MAPPPLTAVLRRELAQFARGCLVFGLCLLCVSLVAWAWLASDIHGMPR